MKFVTTFISVTSLLLFIILIISGKYIIWLALFGVSFIMTLLFGRFYCGYICPMNTLMKPTEWLSIKLGIQTSKVPKWLDSGKFSLILLFLSIVGTIILRKVFSVELPILPIFLIISVIVTVRFKPVIFHKKICPFGVLLSFTGRFSKFSKKVDKEKCVGCKLCENVCPSEAIVVSNKVASIDTSWCFQCTNCQNVCPKDAINYVDTKAKERDIYF